MTVSTVHGTEERKECSILTDRENLPGGWRPPRRTESEAHNGYLSYERVKFPSCDGASLFQVLGFYRLEERFLMYKAIDITWKTVVVDDDPRVGSLELSRIGKRAGRGVTCTSRAS